jgi:UPF0716 protein FxsA
VPLLVLLFILVPIAEIYVIIKVGEGIGVLWTLILLVADSIIGARLLSWQGRRAWREFQAALGAGRMPHREILDGVMIIVGGAFLLTPGFITDFFGLLLLVPPTRAVIRGLLTRSLRHPGVVTRVVIRSRPGQTSRPEPPPSPRGELPK